MRETETMRSWRDALKDICGDPQRKQELSQKVGFVSSRTIERWISGESNPQKHEYVRRLAEFSDEMRELLQIEFSDAFQIPKQSFPIERIGLPSEFYRRVAHAYAHVPLSARRWTIWQLVSNQLLPHLDSERAGLMIISVRSEYDTIHFEEGSGNGFWMTRQVISSICADTWFVQRVLAFHPFFMQSCADADMEIPSCFVRHQDIQSIGFFPLYRSALVGGGILLCSTTIDFFTPLRQTLIEEYSCLLALAFSDNDFH